MYASFQLIRYPIRILLSSFHSISNELIAFVRHFDSIVFIILWIPCVLLSEHSLTRFLLHVLIKPSFKPIQSGARSLPVNV
jgi:ABC-type phosphate/phosphonate transport system permease subunit